MRLEELESLCAEIVTSGKSPETIINMLAARFAKHSKPDNDFDYWSEKLDDLLVSNFKGHIE